MYPIIVFLICLKIISGEIMCNTNEQSMLCESDEDGKLEQLPEFDATADVRNINAASCKIINLPANRFKNFNNLLSVNFSSNYISKLYDNTFGSSLEKIDFSKNAITTLEPSVFTNLPNLVYLDLSDNLLFLHDFSKAMLGKTKNLNFILDGNNPNFDSIQVSSSDGNIQGSDTIIQRIVISLLSDKISSQTMVDVKLKNMIPNTALKLSLRYNNLRSLPQDIFYKCKLVYYLKISNNKLQTLHPETFSKNKILRLIHMQNNQLDYLHDNMFIMNKKITFINLDNNRLRDISSQLFKPLTDLQGLKLSNNLISHISGASFNANTKLLSLDLGGNNLRHLDLSLFARNALIKGLDFSGNKLESFPYEIIAPMKDLEQLRLHNNKLNSIDQKFFDADIKELSIFCNKLHAFPKGVGRIKVSSLYFHGNPWRCACLNWIMSNKINYILVGGTSGFNPMVCIAGRNVSVCEDYPMSDKDFAEWSKAQSSYPDTCHPYLDRIMNFL